MRKIKSKKRIAFVGGGVHTIPSYCALLELLSKQYELTVYSEFYIEPVERPYTIQSVPNRKLHSRIKYLLFFFLILKDQLRKSYDVIHSHSTYPSGVCSIVIGKLFRVPVVVSLDAAEASAIPSVNFGDLLNTRRKRINHWVIGNANEVIVLTAFLQKEIEKNLFIKRPVHIIPRGVDTTVFQYKEENISTPVRFLNVAYLHPVKDHKTLLQCFAAINAKINCTLVQIGEDYNQGVIQQLAREMNLHDKIQFVGFVPHEHLPQYYKQADILLHTSLYESQAVVVSEAMASGVIVCGTHVGLMADLSEEYCITVPTGEGVTLANAVIKLLDDNNAIHKMRRNAYEWTKEHDLQWTAQKHIEIYESIT